LLYKAHGVDFTGFRAGRTNAVRHQNSVFHDILKFVPWAAVDRLVENHGTDELRRKFTTRNQLITLLYAKFSGAASLREIALHLSKTAAATP
jgi:hypothetical protein